MSDTYRVLHTGRLPINKGDTPKWIGITDEGVRVFQVAYEFHHVDVNFLKAPVVYDSSERVMMLEHFRFHRTRLLGCFVGCEEPGKEGW